MPTDRQPPAALERLLDLLCCPQCGGDLITVQDSLACTGCGAAYPIIDAIPRLFHQPPPGTPGPDVTSRVKNFYEATPFPDYDDTEDLASLLRKSREGIFARLLDEQIPFGARVLECGCGTGQLSNFLGLAHRTVFAADMSVSSLRLGQRFKEQHGIENVTFWQMNILAPIFKPGSMDVVISNGVLSAMEDPFLGFRRIGTLVKPGGYVVIGLYHRYGRLGTDLRRLIFELTGDRFQFLDPRLRSDRVGADQKKAWFIDQYKHPQESKHTIGIVLRWLREVGFEFVKSIPRSVPGQPFAESEPLFVPERPGNWLERGLVEWPMALAGSKEGGFFVVIGRRPQ